MTKAPIIFGIACAVTTLIMFRMWWRAELDRIAWIRRSNMDLSRYAEAQSKLNRIEWQRRAAASKGGQATAAKKKREAHYKAIHAQMRPFSDEGVKLYGGAR